MDSYVVVVVVKNTHAFSARFILKLRVSSLSKIGSDSEYLALNLGLYSSDSEYGKRRLLLSTLLACMSSTHDYQRDIIYTLNQPRLANV